MGQSFRLLAPHARLSEEFGGKLGEMIYDGTAERLVELLAVPVRPKFAVNPDRIASQTASQSSRSPEQNECSELQVTVAVKRKANAEMSKSPPPLRKKIKTTSGSHGPNSQSATFSSLPTEIHQLIFSHIEKFVDVLRLGLVNRHLCDIAREQLLSGFCSHFAPWAGQKIVYVGCNTKPNDYPPGLFSDAEIEALSKEEIEVYDEYEQDYITMTPSNLFDFTTPGVSAMQGRIDIELKTIQYRLLSYKLKASENAALTYLGVPAYIQCDHFLPRDQPWVLRNLTTKQFVRAEAIALKPEFIHGPEIKFFGFGHVVLLRICWSSSPVSGVDPENIVRGIWAGHCFDITLLAKHQEETGAGEGWTDISDEVAKEIATFCETNEGPDWRSYLCENATRSSDWW
ncbi:F-box domain containing protein [Metarhizium acridum CQMa 102]|uniref:F-box domain containing protein n=1 Tax=Metarhizium acridum (strain CQMa 102) TaxID=655827 RepID=E9EFN5_METAQ|nr:F-box domain containing protein [Metarhizium acridum CQMa 102]EFY85273.1 F-box domain containing protein [Metarhizium acridum CQMa 102]